jgi:large subunit ribosomal protein L35
MPKMKTNKGAAKRFKCTGSGVFKHRRANRNHILTKKAKDRKRNLRKLSAVSDHDKKAVEILVRGG